MAKDPAAVAALWASRMAQAGPAITAGVQAVTTAPGVSAARRKDAYVAGVQQSANKWAVNVAATTLGEWQQSMIDKGVGRVGSGATAAQAKMANVMAQLLPAIDSVKASLPPRGTLEQNVARSAAFQMGMAKVQIRK